MVTTENLILAFYDCRKNKRSTACENLYEMDFESRLLRLRDRINARTYEPDRSICFVVTRPRYREVFAAAFEDRIVHHYVCMRLEPLFESVFSDRTFNCRKGKGQLYGVERLRDDVRECSRNYTRDCWCAKFDIKGFFMSIDRAMLAAKIDRFIVDRYAGDDIEDLRYLCGVVVNHSPERNCILKSPSERWRHLSADKSLFTNGEGLGMPIGNLPSQLFANFLLNSLDWFLLKDLGFKYVGRYVDDFYVVDESKARILAAAPAIREHLKSLGLTLGRNKFYIQHYTKGVRFTGTIVKCGRVYVNNGTVDGLKGAVDALNRASDIDSVKSAVDSINSYLGYMRHATEYATRRRVLSGIGREAFGRVYIRGHFDTVCIRKRCTPRGVILQGLRNGTCG